MTENLYESIIANFPIGYAHYRIIYDELGRVKDYEFLETNKKFQEGADIEPEELIGRKVSNIFRDQYTWLDFYQSIKNNQEDRELEYTFEKSDKYYRVNIHYPSKNNMVIFSRDITSETKQTENYELFADNTELQIWHLQDPYTYGTTNKAHANFIGLEKKDLEFKKLTSFLPSEEAAVCVEVNKKVFEEKEQTVTREWVINAEGERRLIKVLKTPKFNLKGEVEFISCSAEDITEEYKLQQEKKIKEDILYAMIHFTEELLTNEHHYQALANSIEVLGNAAQVDRVYYWENHYDQKQEEWFTSQKFEWCLDGVVEQIDNPNLQNNSFEDVGDFVGILAENKAFITHIKDMEETLTKEILASQGILSILVLPVFTNDIFQGFIGFDSCRFEREWSNVEISLLDSFVLLYEKAVERSFMEQHLMQVKDNFDNFFNMIDDFLLVFDQKGMIINANDTVLRKLDYSREEVVGQSAKKIHPDEKSEQSKKRMQGIKSKERSIFSAEARKKDGSIIPIETHVSEGIWDDEEVFFAVSKDISELTMSEEKFSKAFNLSGTSMIISTIEDGEFIEVNDAFLELIGYEREEIIGKKIDKEHIFRALTQGEDTRETIKEEIERNHRIHNYEIEIISKENVVKTGMCNIVSVYINNELYFLTNIVDITESKQLTQELARAKKESDIANEAKSQFLSHISHEIRTPMNAVIGYSNLLTSTTLTQKQGRYLEGIKASTAMLMSIINDILDWSKIDTDEIELEIKKFSIDNVINNVVEQQRFKDTENIQDNVEIIVEKSVDIPDFLYGDYLRLQQVLLNLLSNAVKFTEVGEIIIQVDVAKKESDTITLEFKVIDTGIGIAEEVIPTIFEPFKQADNTITNTHGGTGLGLSICNKIVEVMNGSIGVNSKVNEGSTFYFTVDLDLQAPAGCKDQVEDLECCQISSTSSYDQLINSEVLVVDDNLINQDVLKEILEEVGVIVTLASTGVEAIEKVRAKEFDIVLMDLRMPIMNGYDTTEKIRKIKSSEELPIIAVSASVSPDEVKRCARSGIHEFVTKPIEKNKLFSAMSTLINKDAIYSEQNFYIKDKEIPTEKKKDQLIYSIDGIDIEKAIKHLNNNEELFLSILRRFKGNYEQVVEEINQALSLGDRELATRLAHTVKGVSGELSATEVYVIAGDIEKELVKGSDNIGVQLEKLDRQLSKIFKSEVFLEEETEKKSMSSEKTKELNIEIVQPLLKKLGTLLLESNPDSIDCIERVERKTKNTFIDYKIKEMKELTEQYDFESALSLLDEVKEILNEKGRL